VIVNMPHCLSWSPVYVSSLPLVFTHLNLSCSGHVACVSFQSVAISTILDMNFTLGALSVLYTLQYVKKKIFNFVEFVLTLCNALIAIPS
jgi:hypothetical protein